MKQRAITTLVGIPIALVIILWPGGVPATVAVGVILALAYSEFVSLCAAAGFAARLWEGTAGITLLVLAVQGRVPVDGWIGAAGMVLAGLVVLFETVRSDRRPVAALGPTLMGVAWIGGLGSLFIAVRFANVSDGVTLWSRDTGGWAAVALLIVVWSLDIFAYLIGKTFGRTLLAPSLSPKKTLEGALGGFFAAAIAGVVVHSMLGISIQSGAMLGAAIGLAGQVGDLFESAVKREVGVKDSGGMLPGHGGWLDRIDSLLFASAIAAWWLTAGPR
ncbi:MAG: phosphatidate cytidylyltransferase [Armatimonadota bacterium]